MSCADPVARPLRYVGEARVGFRLPRSYVAARFENPHDCSVPSSQKCLVNASTACHRRAVEESRRKSGSNTSKGRFPLMSIATRLRGIDMIQTVGAFVVSRLYAWGVRRMFGYPGDGINRDQIEFIQFRHEEMAAT